MNINSLQQSVCAYSAKATLSQDGETKATDGKKSEQTEDVMVDLGKAQAKNGTYANPKRLSADEVKALQDSQAAQQAKFLQSMMQANVKNQSQQFLKATQLNFDGVLINAAEFQLPEGGSTPEEAAKAIAKGGAYSVEAVADRIFSLAEKIANGDSDKLQTMRDAVEKGFKQAGLSFKSTANGNLPDICNDTYDNIMDRFDKLAEKLNPSKDEEAAAQ